MMLPRAMKIFAALLFLLGAGLLAGTFFYQSRFAQTVQMMKPYDKATRELRDGEIGSEVGSPARVFVTDKSKLLNNGEPNAQGHPLWDYSQGAPMFVSTAWGLMGLLTGIFWLIGGLSWVVASRAAQRRTVPPVAAPEEIPPLPGGNNQPNAPVGKIEPLIDLDHDRTTL